MLRSFALIASLVALTHPAYGQEDLAASLRQGGYVIVLRHGATSSGTSDPMGAGRGKNTATERLLSPRGRQSAREIGDAFKTLHIPIGAVYSSQLQRAVDTGRLVSGKQITTSADFTEAGDHVSPVESDRRAEAMRKIAATPPAKGTNTLVVSHKPNIVDAFGKDWSEVREGEASIFKPAGNGKFALLARVQASEWAELAKRR